MKSRLLMNRNALVEKKALITESLTFSILEIQGHLKILDNKQQESMFAANSVILFGIHEDIAAHCALHRL